LAKAVDAYITERADDLVALVRGLVGFNTVSVDLSPGSEHRENEELELQRLVGDRLAALGAEVDQFEPDAAALRDHPTMPPWHHWKRRPITVGGTLRGDQRPHRCRQPGRSRALDHAALRGRRPPRPRTAAERST
jgi:acetylornithine deacetylase/succinyl-diaminopimelate desuccinylase-like protein